MEKYLRVAKDDFILINSQYNTVQEEDIKISEEVFEYYLTLFDKVYNKKTITEKEINTKEELNKYLVSKEKETINMKQFISTREAQLWNIIEELGTQIAKVENELATLKS